MPAPMGQTALGPVRDDGGTLDERVLSALQGLSGRLAFSGLRRMLGTHPESLARSLRRLEREGVVERIDGTYRALVPAPTVDAGSDRALRSIAEIELPPSATPKVLAGRLVGRWFGSLRWVGLLERPDGELLAWARRDGGGLILLGVRHRSLRVYVPASSSASDPSEDEEAAYELLYHAVEALRPSSAPPAPTAATVRAFELGRTREPTDN